MAIVGLAAALLVAAALVFHTGRRRAADAALRRAAFDGDGSAERRRGPVGGAGVSTTYVTGTLITAIVDFLGAPRGAGERRQGIPNVWTWVLYLVGAIAGTLGLGLLGDRALWPAAAVVALLIPVL